MDKIDFQLINLLKKDARMPLKDLAEKVFLSSPATAARLERLEKKGIISGYSVPAGDHAALAGLARRLAAEGADSETGERGAEYCRVNFPRGGFMDRLISVLEGKDT